MKDMISVIIPFYNSSKMIARCIQSILAQTYENFEILLINDGSTDNTATIIKEEFQSDHRVRLINKEHAGVSSARNRGLKEAAGEYIQFIDSDDYIEPQMFEKMHRIMTEQNADMVVCNFDHPCIRAYGGNQVFDMAKSEDRIRFCQSTFVSVLPWDKLYKKELITDLFDEDLAFAEDELFVFANMCNAKKIVCTDEVLYHYYSASPDAPYEELSCITKLAKEANFWVSKKTYWYMRAALMPKVQDILYKHFRPQEFGDILYCRAFDYMIWELLILYYNGAAKSGIHCEMQSIFREKKFIESIKLKEKYGVRMVRLSEEELTTRVTGFTESCMNAYDDILRNHRTEQPFYVFLSFFVMYFVEQCGPLDRTDLVADLLYQMQHHLSKEADFIKNVYLEENESLTNVM